MCELLVRIVDKISDDPYNNAKLTKSGDVIVICDDGHEWGRAEGPPTYRVIRVPGVEAATLGNFTGRGVPEGPDDAMSYARVWGLDVSALPDVVTLEQVQRAKVRRIKPVDPNVLE